MQYMCQISISQKRYAPPSHKPKKKNPKQTYCPILSKAVDYGHTLSSRLSEIMPTSPLKPLQPPLDLPYIQPSTSIQHSTNSKIQTINPHRMLKKSTQPQHNCLSGWIKKFFVYPMPENAIQRCFKFPS